MRKRWLLPEKWKSVALFGLLVSLAGALAAEPALHGDQARALIEQLEPKVQEEPALKTPLGEAKAALKRASAARKPAKGEGDSQKATRLDHIALEWAELARDLERATAVERQALEAERALTDLETKLVRARALLEETWARRGRAETALKRLNADATAQPNPAEEPAAPGAPPAKPSPAPKPASKPKGGAQ